MNVNFYKINKKVNSTLIPSGDGTQINVVLKSPSSIINPRFELNQYLDVNYCYVAEFNRYYFINEIRYENPLWIYSCNADVLASFKTEIGASTKYVLRSASSYDLTIRDNLYPNKANFSNSVATINPSIPFSSGYIVVGVLGNNSNTNGITYYQTTPVGYSSLISKLLTEADGYDWGDLTQGVINSLMNPFQYLVNARWYPEPFVVNGQTTIKAGLWDSKVNAGIIDSSKSHTSTFNSTGRMNIPKHPKASTRGQYLNLQPYTKVSLISGLFGTVDLDTSLLLNSDTMYFTLYKDFAEGNGRLIINDSSGTNGTTLADIKFKYGIDLPLTANLSSGAGAMALGIGGVALGLATGGTSLAIGGAVGFIGGAMSELQPSISINGNLGGILLHSAPTYLKAVFYDIVDEDLTNKGRPLCQMKTINTLSGYLICEDGNINSNATEQEKESIASHLTSGFYYE